MRIEASLEGFESPNVEPTIPRMLPERLLPFCARIPRRERRGNGGYLVFQEVHRTDWSPEEITDADTRAAMMGEGTMGERLDRQIEHRQQNYTDFYFAFEEGKPLIRCHSYELGNAYHLKQLLSGGLPSTKIRKDDVAVFTGDIANRPLDRVTTTSDNVAITLDNCSILEIP